MSLSSHHNQGVAKHKKYGVELHALNKQVKQWDK